MSNHEKTLVGSGVTIREAMKAIDAGSIRMVVVVDGQGRLVGTVSDGDVRRGILKGLTINEPVTAVVNRNASYVSEDTPDDAIIRLIMERDIIGVPIVDGDRVVRDFALVDEKKQLKRFNRHIIPTRKLAKVGVIGGAGFIGSVLVHKLLQKGYKVKVLDKFIYGDKSLKDVAGESDLEIIHGDTRHVEDVNDAIRDVDAVVHLAELVGDPACAVSPMITQEINYLATLNIANICKHYQINKLVYASSCSVYGASESDDLLNENSGLNPVSLYAKMKIACERAIMDLADGNFGPTILRLSTVFGNSYRPRFDLVVNLLTAKAYRDGQITIFGGDQWRPNVHVEDVADTIRHVLEAPIEKTGGEIFNVGSEENNHTINDIGYLIQKEIPTARVVIEDKVMDKRNYRVDFSKLRERLGFRMKRDVRYGIAEVKRALERDPSMDYRDARYSNIKYLEGILGAATVDDAFNGRLVMMLEE